MPVRRAESLRTLRVQCRARRIPDIRRVWFRTDARACPAAAKPAYERPAGRPARSALSAAAFTSHRPQSANVMSGARPVTADSRAPSLFIGSLSSRRFCRRNPGSGIGGIAICNTHSVVLGLRKAVDLVRALIGVVVCACCFFRQRARHYPRLARRLLG